MYRGDDIYLLDWWPLDNQNTVGGGAGYKFHWTTDETTIAAHVGMQRLDNTYQYEQIPVPTPPSCRRRRAEPSTSRCSTARAPSRRSSSRTSSSTRTPPREGRLQVHPLRRGPGDLGRRLHRHVRRALRPDTAARGLGAGWSAREVAYWTGQRDTFVQLFVRHAEGSPRTTRSPSRLTFANDRTTRGASETLVALGGNYERGCLRRARRRLPARLPRRRPVADDVAEVRRGHPRRAARRSSSASAGASRSRALPGAALRRARSRDGPAARRRASGARASSRTSRPSGRGSYKRPQLRLIYALTARNAATRELYPAAGRLLQRTIEHLLGLGRVVVQLDARTREAMSMTKHAYSLSCVLVAIARRRASLVARDRRASRSPTTAQQPALATHVQDWRDEVIYQVIVDRFADGDVNNDFNVEPGALDQYQGGDWQGIEDHLDYIQALGVTTLWISPIVQNVDSDADVDGYHGYWQQDLTAAQPALRRPRQPCVRWSPHAHDRGMKVVLDIVCNHMGQVFFYDINLNGRPDDYVEGSGGSRATPRADQRVRPATGSPAASCRTARRARRPRADHLLRRPEHQPPAARARHPRDGRRVPRLGPHPRTSTTSAAAHARATSPAA